MHASVAATLQGVDVSIVSASHWIEKIASAGGRLVHCMGQSAGPEAYFLGASSLQDCAYAYKHS